MGLTNSDNYYCIGKIGGSNNTAVQAKSNAFEDSQRRQQENKKSPEIL